MVQIEPAFLCACDTHLVQTEPAILCICDTHMVQTKPAFLCTCDTHMMCFWTAEINHPLEGRNSSKLWILLIEQYASRVMYTQNQAQSLYNKVL